MDAVPALLDREDAAEIRSTGPATFTWDVNTGEEVRRRHKRKQTAEESKRALEVRESGGACEDCRRAKRRCTHVESNSDSAASPAPVPRKDHGSSTRTAQPPAVTLQNPGRTTFDAESNRLKGLKALAETLWEDLATAEPALSDLARGQYNAWMSVSHNTTALEDATQSSEVASIESFVKESRRLIDSEEARDEKSWKRVRRFALTLIPSVASESQQHVPWNMEGLPPYRIPPLVGSGNMCAEPLSWNFENPPHLSFPPLDDLFPGLDRGGLSEPGSSSSLLADTTFSTANLQDLALMLESYPEHSGLEKNAIITEAGQSQQVPDLGARQASIDTLPDRPDQPPTPLATRASRRTPATSTACGIRPYECPDRSCGKSFPDKAALDHHFRYHMPRQNICSVCDRAFLFPKDLNRHMSSVHGKQRYFRCRFVGCRYNTIGFQRADHLHRHLRHKHGFERPFTSEASTADSAQHGPSGGKTLLE